MNRAYSASDGEDTIRRVIGTDELTAAVDAGEEYPRLLQFSELRDGNMAALIAHDHLTGRMDQATLIGEVRRVQHE